MPHLKGLPIADFDLEACRLHAAYLQFLVAFSSSDFLIRADALLPPPTPYYLFSVLSFIAYAWGNIP
jgi:hypothetical protein